MRNTQESKEVNIGEFIRFIETMNIAGIAESLRKEQYMGIPRKVLITRFESIFNYLKIQGDSYMNYIDGTCSGEGACNHDSKKHVYVFYGNQTHHYLCLAFQSDIFNLIDFSACYSFDMHEKEGAPSFDSCIELSLTEENGFFKWKGLEINQRKELFYYADRKHKMARNTSSAEEYLNWYLDFAFLINTISNTTNPNLQFEKQLVSNLESFLCFAEENKIKFPKVVYDYTPEYPDELKIKIAQLQQVIEREKMSNISHLTKVIELILKKDIPMLEAILPSDSYCDLPREQFCKKLQHLLNQFPKELSLTIHEGFCTSCFCGMKGYTFYDNKGMYLDLVFDVKDDLVVDIMECRGLRNKDGNLNKIFPLHIIS